MEPPPGNLARFRYPALTVFAMAFIANSVNVLLLVQKPLLELLVPNLQPFLHLVLRTPLLLDF